MSDNEEKFSSYVNLMKEILQIAEYFIEWKVLCPVAFVASAILLLCEFSLIHIILGSMFEIIRSSSAFILMLTFIGISYKCVAGVFLYTKARVEKHMLQKYTARMQQEKEAIEARMQQEKETAEIYEVETLLNQLPERELRIIKYMYEKGGITWLPVKDGAVLNLFDARCIYPAINVSMLRGELIGENSQCFACKLTPIIERNITKLNGDFLNRWSQLHPASWLSIYEHSAE